MSVEVTMPGLGDALKGGLLLKWNKRNGDTVKAGEVIGKIETAKSLVEMEPEVAGVISIYVKAGDYVPVGAVLAVIN